MAVSLMFVPCTLKPAAGPAVAVLTRPRPRGASSPATAGECAELRTRRRAGSSPPLLFRRFLPTHPLTHGLLRWCKMDYSDRPGLFRRRAVPRTGKHSAPLGIAAGSLHPRTVPHSGTAPAALSFSPAGHLSLTVPIFPNTIALLLLLL